MSKRKMLKLTTIISLYALFKHTDEEHRLNSVKLNEFLRPYGLECSGYKTLNKTIKALRMLGVEIKCKGWGSDKGFYVVNRPLNNDELNILVYAVTTNPNLSNEQIDEVLQSIKPFVTVYQEGLLKI